MRALIIILTILGGAYFVAADDVKTYIVSERVDGILDLEAVLKKDPLIAQTDQERRNFDSVRNWARLAVEEIGYISHNSVREDLEKSRVFFTQSGWNKYLEAIKVAGLIPYLKENDATQILRLIGQPEIYEYNSAGDRFQNSVIGVPARLIKAEANGQTRQEDFKIFLSVLNSGASNEFVPYGIEQIVFW
jgi:hypothetical protein